MKILAFNFTCDRDNDLSVLMVQTLNRHCDNLTSLQVYNTDHDKKYKGYGNGAGWPQSMLKLDALRQISCDDNDFILSIDSDVVFGAKDVFLQLDPEYGIIGIKHTPEYWTHFGSWSHMSGALIFIRGDIAKKIAALSEEELNRIRYEHFKAYGLTENEDVVLSYLCSYVGAKQKALPGFVSSNNFESDIRNALDQNGKTIKADSLRSFYHLNYCPTVFLGEMVGGKWDIPKVLDKKGIRL